MIPSIVSSTENYKDWLRGQTSVDEPGLQLKDTAMAADAFSHLRATYYRWVELFALHCSNLVDGWPALLAVGDLHVQNFGTWRDGEGRLVWGIDDFDEADDERPFTSDLVRLAVSAVLSADVNLPPEAICAELLRGYRTGLSDTSRPFVLDERNEWLRDLAHAALKPPEKFWRKWLADKTIPLKNADIDPGAIEAFSASYPPDSVPESFRGTNPENPKGLGSLGRRRFFAYNPDWLGGPLAREAKAAVPPATRIGQTGFKSLTEEIQKRAVRSPDPVYRLHGRWVCKAIMATTGRIEMEDLPAEADRSHLLQAMGQETANVHRGTSANPTELVTGLDRLKGMPFFNAVTEMANAVTADWQQWRKHYAEAQPHT